ncbi:MAG TPA: hypothetical protein VNN73_02035 [Blastocatellia bacterium]|nr:hypothetical protein [Blastocatellia bacterium]
MLNLTATLVKLILLLALAVAQNAGLDNLRDVRSVFLDDLGQSDNAKLFRRELISRLNQSGRVRIVASRDEADAALNVDVSQSSVNNEHLFGDVMMAGSQG